MTIETTDGARAGGVPRQRLLAVGCLVVAVGVVWLALVAPILDAMADQAERLEAARALGAQYRAVAAERPVLERRRQELDAAARGRSSYLTAVSDGAAGAALQKLVKGAVERAGGTVQSTQPQPVRSEDGFRRIGVRLQLTATIEALRQALHAIEGHEPFLFVDGIEVRARQAQRSSGAKIAEDRTLEVRMDVYGLARPAT
ncbi:MAG TPA: type II secretion system protein GspM [Azospirillum sp.]|nr:type II secretion system protein GspM [Azospirillum sp.]